MDDAGETGGKGITSEPLVRLLRERIAAAYPSQKAFADAVGLPPTYVNQLLMGRVAVPKREQRKLLARELGLRELDFFVMAGEIPASDAAPASERLTTTERELVEAFRALPSGLRSTLMDTIRELMKHTGPSRP